MKPTSTTRKKMSNITQIIMNLNFRASIKVRVIIIIHIYIAHYSLLKILNAFWLDDYLGTIFFVIRI